MIHKWEKSGDAPQILMQRNWSQSLSYFSPATQTVLQAVNMQFGPDSLVLLLVSSS